MSGTMTDNKVRTWRFWHSCVVAFVVGTSAYSLSHILGGGALVVTMAASVLAVGVVSFLYALRNEMDGWGYGQIAGITLAWFSPFYHGPFLGRLEWVVPLGIFMGACCHIGMWLCKSRPASTET